MAKKYSKYTSNYILSQPIQRTEKGTINLRDWTTIGEFERLAKGKKPVFGNGEFRFTVRNIASNPTKHIVSKFVGSYDYNDVKDVLPKNNLTELNLFTNDLRDYAYYGSAVELVRATIQNILRTFPARITISDERIHNRKQFVMDNNVLSVIEVVDYDFQEDFDVFESSFKVDENDVIINKSKYITTFLISNPFDVDIHHDSIILGEYTNPHRFLTYSFKDFVISENGIDFEPIIKYTVNIEYNKVDKKLEYPRGRYNCVFDGCKVAEIIINTETHEYILKGYLFNNTLKWGYDCVVEVNSDGFETRQSSLYIQPNQTVIDEYFNKLQGLEKILLQRETKPLYQCRLKTPYIENEVMMTSDRPYQFPNKDGFIDIESPSFTIYVQQLTEIANIWDTSYSDNLYQRMTHESIKNYDWSYKKDEDENEKDEIFVGGLRIENLLHIYGRLFDDIKHYIDGIKNAHIITYDGYNNMPTAQITDELEDGGWHIINTIPILDIEEDNKIISKEFSNQIITDDLLDVNNQQIKWFNNKNKSELNFVQNNLNFMKKLVLNSNYIFKSKGTKKSIEMIMGMFGFGDNDFSIEEVCYITKPKRFDANMSNTFDNLIASFEGLVTEDTPEGSLPIKIKDYYYQDINGNEDCSGIEYLVPFLNPKDIVDVDLYFQGKGGWCKNSDDTDRKDYIETMSYLRIKYTLEELFSLSPNSVKDGDIFYVVDITDFANYYLTQSPTSHYFAITDVNNIYNSSGWTNVNPNNTSHNKYNEYIQYMESIVATNIANNPHVGYGHYDSGNYYLENIKNPFKYAEDNFVVTFDEYSLYKNEQELQNDLNKFKFTLSECNVKTFFINDKYVKEYLDTDGKIKENIPDYYINSKVVRLTNNLTTNKYFTEYFKEVILPYIMQVIPSTTILILKGF